MEWVETTSSTVEEASSRALDLLGVDGSDAEIEVLDEGKKGLFGRVKTEARVRARIKPKAPPQKEERGRRNDRNDRGRSRGKGGQGRGQGNKGGGNNRNRNQGGGQGGGQGRGQGNKGGSGNSGNNRNQGGGRAAAAAGAGGAAAVASQGRNQGGESSRDRDGGNRDGGNRDGGNRDGGSRDGGNRGNNRDGGNNRDRNRQGRNNQENNVEEEFTIAEQEEAMSSFVSGLATLFDADAKVSMVSDDENLEAKVEGGDVGLMIGPGGNTLTAIEELARTAMQRAAAGRRYHRIRVDVDGYKERRREALGAFAVKLAGDVKESGSRKALEPMNSADRKVVHDALSDVEGVMTLSEGDDPRRYVVVAPTD